TSPLRYLVHVSPQLLALRLLLVLFLMLRPPPISTLFPYTTLFRSYFHVKYNTLYFISIKCVLCEAIGSASKTLHTDYQYAQNLRSEEHTSELQSRFDLVCRLLLEKKKKTKSSRE